MMATVLPVRSVGGFGTIQPISKPLSMIAHSIDLIPTGSSLMPRTQAPSQGAGQTRPVNSGKLFVMSRRFSASFHWFWNTSSFHFGMMLEIGHPESDWQKGTPQSMQRAAWYFSSSSSRRLDSSAQSRVRVFADRYFSERRWY